MGEQGERGLPRAQGSGFVVVLESIGDGKQAGGHRRGCRGGFAARPPAFVMTKGIRGRGKRVELYP